MPTFKPTYNIFINGVSKNTLENLPIDEIRIIRSLETIEDYAMIRFSGQDDSQGREIEEEVRRGRYVEISVGWNADNVTEFKGYIQNVTTGDGLYINLMDFSFLFRTTLIEEKSFSATATAQEVLQYLADQVNDKKKSKLPADVQIVVAVDRALLGRVMPNFKIPPVHGLEALRMVARQLPYNIFFRDNVICLWRRFVQDSAVRGIRKSLQVDKNVKDFSLEYMHAEDREYVCQAIGIRPDGSVITGEASTNDLGEGEIIRQHFAISPEAPPEAVKQSLDRDAQEMLKVWSYDGFKGTITSWIVPYIDRGHIVALQDDKYAQREGLYFVISYQLVWKTNQGTFRILNVGQTPS